MQNSNFKKIYTIFLFYTSISLIFFSGIENYLAFNKNDLS